MHVNKWSEWWDNLPEHTKIYLETQPIWHDKDLIRTAIIAAIVGFFIGFLVGYDVGLSPITNTFRPLTG